MLKRASIKAYNKTSVSVNRCSMVMAIVTSIFCNELLSSAFSVQLQGVIELQLDCKE